MAYPFNNVAIGVSSHLSSSTGNGEIHMQHIRTSGTRFCAGNRLAARAICIRIRTVLHVGNCTCVPKECTAKGLESTPQKRWLRKDPNQSASWYRLCDSHGEITTQVSGGMPVNENLCFLSPMMLDIWISVLDQADRLESQRSSPRQTRDPSAGCGRESPHGQFLVPLV